MWSCIRFKGSTEQLVSQTSDAEHNGIKPRHKKRHQDAYITVLMSHHYPTGVDYRGTEELIRQLEKADKEEVANDIKAQLREALEATCDDLIRMRKNTFKVINVNDRSVYGVLKKGYSSYDRDRYIRILMAFSESIIQLQRFKQHDETADPLDNITEDKKAQINLLSTGLYEKSLAIRASALIPPRSGLYGDLEALALLKTGQKGRLPDLTYYQDVSDDGVPNDSHRNAFV